MDGVAYRRIGDLLALRPPIHFSASGGHRMIVAALTGGLGNQMFQYAHARAQSQRLGVPLAIDRRWYDLGNRGFDLAHFDISARLLGAAEAGQWMPQALFEQYFAFRPRRAYQRVWHRIATGVRSLGRRNIVSEQEAFTANASDIHAGSYVMGYWEGFHFFASVAEEIRREFTPREALRGDVRDLIARIRDCPCPVAIHVRRGDRATSSELQGYCPISHYMAGWNQIRQELPAAQAFLFSDDIDSARALADQIPGAIVAESPGRISGWESFWAMRHCDHFVLSNSTFSWWSAWLAKNPQKQVFVPAEWYLEPPTRFSALGPPDWRELDTQLARVAET
jgi:hypothetical protein